MSHTVTITRLPDAQSDDFEFEFGGTHGGDCAVLMPCKRKACQAMKPDYGDERSRHGKEHTFLDGDWLVESDQCALRYVFEQSGPEETFEGLTLSTYPVRIEWEGYGWWLEVQNAPAPVPVEPEKPIEFGASRTAGLSGGGCTITGPIVTPTAPHAKEKSNADQELHD